MKASLYIYIFVMWIMIVAGGGLVIAMIVPLKIDGFGEYGIFLDSAVKAIIAILLVALWIFIMSKMKNWIFRKQIKN